MSSQPPPTRRAAAAASAHGEEGAINAPSAPRGALLVDGRRIRGGLTASTDTRISVLAERQRGRASRDQLLAVGVEPTAIKRRLRNGQLDREHRGVYRLPHTAAMPLGPETAALLACGKGAVLSHHSAVTLWGLRPGTARPIHVTIPGERGCPDPDGVIVHRSRILASRDVRIRNGLPVTSPARACLDVAATLTDRDVERLLDEALFVQRLATLAQVRDVLARAGGHPGRARLARAAANHTRPIQTDSPPEEKLFGIIRAAALPEPILQASVLGYQLDFFWPKLRLAVEVDAYSTHGSRARFEADRRRDARLLTEEGVSVLRLTRAMIEERPFEAIAVVARAVGQREATLRP